MGAAPAGIDRVIVVVMDGVRADSVPLFGMPHLERLAARGGYTWAARTVTPSVTAAAMGSLFSGMRPSRHGLDSDRFRLPAPAAALGALPRVLAAGGVATTVCMASLPRAFRPLARAIAARLGVQDVHDTGHTAREILAGTRPVLARRRGLLVCHWPDADRAGHASGWTSSPYRAALRDLDDALGALDALTGASEDERTVLVVLADHGGGGTTFDNHASAHAHDVRIPLVIAGGRVAPHRIDPGTSLLDVPATVARLFACEVPDTWDGCPLDVLTTARDERVPDESRYALVAAG